MPGDWDKNVHPDLVEETPQTDAPSTHGEAAPADTTPETPDSATDSSFSADEPQASTEPPEWFAAVRDAKDPTEALRLLAKNLPRDQIEKDEVMSGLIGQIGDRRAREPQRVSNATQQKRPSSKRRATTTCTRWAR